MPAKKKLTLSVDEEIIERAHRFSDEHDTSISELVSSFLSRLDTPRDRAHSPLVKRLRGILPSDVSIEKYRAHLEEKHD